MGDADEQALARLSRSYALYRRMPQLKFVAAATTRFLFEDGHTDLSPMRHVAFRYFATIYHAFADDYFDDTVLMISAAAKERVFNMKAPRDEAFRVKMTAEQRLASIALGHATYSEVLRHDKYK